MIYRERRKTVKQCPSCRAVIDDDARFCIFCAESVDEKRRIEIKRFDGKNSLRAAVACVCAAVVVFTVTVGAMSVRRNSAPPRLPEPESETAVTVSAVPDQPQEDTPDESTEPAGAVTDATDTPFAPADETTDTDAAGTPAADTSPADVPETTEPETTKPETTKPETTKPESTKPETTKPEAIKPEATKPEATAPDTTRPETTKPETTIPATTSPETTADEITTAPETEGEESSVQIQTPGIAIVSADSFAGGPPENEEEMLTKQYLFAIRNHFGGWLELIFGYDNPEIGSTVQLEDLVMPDRVYFSDDGNAVVTARLYTDGKDVDFRMLKYSVGMDQADTSFEDHVRENSGMKRPAGWRGLMTEAGIDVDPYSEDDMAKQYPEATGIRPVSYEYWVTYLTGADRTIKVTIEKRVGKILPEGGYETSVWWYPDVTDWFTLAEYVD